MSGIDGLAPNHWLPVSAGLWYVVSCAGLTGVAFGLFTRELLPTKVNLPRWDQVILGMMALCLFIALTAPFLPTELVELYSPVTGFLMPGVLLVAGILALKHKSRAARFYLYAWSAYLFGFFAYTSVYLGWPLLDFSLLEMSLFSKASSLIEVSLLALALADRIQGFKREKEEARSSLVEALRSHGAELEAKVLQRTRELRLANETKDKFFSIISHDLRGPIGSLAVIFNEVVHKGADLEGDLFEGIKRSTRNLHRLLEDLLVWAKSQRGELEVHPFNYFLADSIRQSAELVSAQLEQKNIELRQHCPADLEVWADPSVVTTVVRNLLGNAIKFTEPGGWITVTGIAKENEVEVSVIDNGKGMTLEMTEKLFRIDHRIRSSQSPTIESGSGLGLILCAEFIAKAGGRIGVESEPGKGSRFWFTLPLGRQVEGRPAWKERLGELRILVVEDERLHQESTGKVLRELGLNFQVAENGLEAVERATTESFDLVLMDIDMPVLNGIEAGRRLRLLDNPPGWIVSLSAYTEGDLKLRSPEFQFNGFLNKPLESERMLGLLRQFPGRGAHFSSI